MTEIKWINKFIDSFLNTMEGIHLSTVQPLCFLSFQPLFEKAVLEKFALLKEKHEKSGISLKELSASLKNPSLLRVELLCLLLDMKFARLERKERINIANFLFKMLKETFKQDIFGLKSNVVKDSNEIKNLIENIEWKKSTPEAAKILGRIYNSGYNYACSNFTDIYMYHGVDNEGPYDVSEQFGDGHILIIKKLTNLKPIEIWPNSKKFPHKEITMYCVYRDIKYKSDLISAHTNYKGNIIDNLRYYSVYLNGNAVPFAKKLASINKDLENASAHQWKFLNSLSIYDLKIKSQEIRLYCLKEMLEQADINWKPSKEMKDLMKRPLFEKEKWNIPKNKELEAEYWKKVLNPELDFYPGDKLSKVLD